MNSIRPKSTCAVAKPFDMAREPYLQLYQLSLPERIELIIRDYLYNRHFHFGEYISLREIRADLIRRVREETKTNTTICDVRGPTNSQGTAVYDGGQHCSVHVPKNACNKQIRPSKSRPRFHYMVYQMKDGDEL